MVLNISLLFLSLLPVSYLYFVAPDVVSNETALNTGEDAVTQQCFKDECDINILLAKFAVTGQLPENVRVPQYVDFEEAFDFPVTIKRAVSRFHCLYNLIIRRIVY